MYGDTMREDFTITEINAEGVTTYVRTDLTREEHQLVLALRAMNESAEEANAKCEAAREARDEADDAEWKADDASANFAAAVRTLKISRIHAYY